MEHTRQQGAKRGRRCQKQGLMDTTGARNYEDVIVGALKTRVSLYVINHDEKGLSTDRGEVPLALLVSSETAFSALRISPSLTTYFRGV